MVPDIWSVTDRIFCHFGPFFALLSPLTTRKIKISKKRKNHLEILLYTCVPQMKTIWSMVPEIWSLWQTEFFVILDRFLLFYPPNYPKNQNVEKMKKTHGDVIILHKCIINDNHMMYGSWDRKCDGQNFLLFWTSFLPFNLITTRKIKIFKNWKKTHGDIIILHKCTKSHDHMIYCSLAMACNRFNGYFLFRAIFFPFASVTAQKIKIFKKLKNILEISLFYNSVPRIMMMCYTVPEIWCMTGVIIFHFGPFFALLPPPPLTTAQKIKILRK